MTDESKTSQYSPARIEPKWQAYWEAERTFATRNPGEPGFDAKRPKRYILDFFPYPSGTGLHVGHPEGYTATDIMARYRRMRGDNVLHPMGWDAFGLPAEQHAIETGQHPAKTTEKNIGTFRRQLKMLGFSFDWSREFATCDPDYYRWTQWIFLKIFNSWYDTVAQKARPVAELPIPGDVKARGEKAVREYVDSRRLAYMAEMPVNWCPALGTVLSNEEVTNEGRSDRGNHPVFRRPMRQWMLRITAYADRLANDLEELDWPESVKIMQRNWIGRSEGAQVQFKISGRSETLEIFTTRPDTLFGATYMVLAPEHPLVEKITASPHRAAVRAYCETAGRKSELARTSDAKTKTGVDTGAFAINPVDGDQIPIWVADYVLMGYGTGAIMAVPAGDTRDFEFARQFDLPIVAVVMPDDAWLQIYRPVDSPEDAETLRKLYSGDPGSFREAFTDEGVAINSGEFNGLTTPQFKKKIVTWLDENKLGHGTVQYKLRDWLFSRQHYWGEPFPILHGEDGEVVPLDEAELPLTLPAVDDYRPTVSEDNEALPEPPLARAKEWVNVTRNGKRYRRELNTMPQWAGSCWYYLRFCDPRNDKIFCDRDIQQYWMLSKRKDGKPHVGGVDLYLGGAEHAVLHLLYARFWHKVLYDLGYLSTVEPFGKLFNQGMIRAFAYRDARGVPLGYDEIDFRDDGAYAKGTGEKLIGNVEKMSKSLKNVINPEDGIAAYGADAFRLYEMFMGPLEASKPWNPRDVPGVFRFLQRAWRLIVDEDTGHLRVDQSRDRKGAPSDAASEKSSDTLEAMLHKTIKKVGEDIERMAFNTAISTMMEFVNEGYRVGGLTKSQAERFVLVLAPFAPHIAEELWHRLRGPGWKTSLTYETWPTFEPALVEDEQVEIPVQVNGKVVDRMKIARDAGENVVKDAAMALPKVSQRIGTASVHKTIFVPGRMLNLVVK